MKKAWLFLVLLSSTYQINGQKIFARGGYIQPDALWEWTPERIDAEIRYYAQANLNLIYFEDIANPPDYLFDACDRYGVMIGQCFYGCSWMKTGSKYPGDVPLVVQCTRDILKRYRNHPSLVMYMASNEGFTREEVYRPWRASVIELDGSRFWVPSNGMPNVAPDKVQPWFREDMPTGMTDLRVQHLRLGRTVRVLPASERGSQLDVHGGVRFGLPAAAQQPAEVHPQPGRSGSRPDLPPGCRLGPSWRQQVLPAL